MSTLVLRTGKSVWALFVLQIAVWITWSYMLGPSESNGGQSGALFWEILAWVQILAFFVVPLVAVLVGMAALFRYRTQTRALIVGLILNAACVLVFVFFAYLTLYGGV